MPIYKFRCRDCGSEFELKCTVAEMEAGPLCESCGSRELQRVYGNVGFSLKCNPPSCPHTTDSGCCGCCHAEN